MRWPSRAPSAAEDHDPSQLSGGPAAARGDSPAPFVTNPDVILADEADGETSDTARSHEIIGPAHRAQPQGPGITILMVTHEPDMRGSMPTGLIHLVDGRHPIRHYPRQGGAPCLLKRCGLAPAGHFLAPTCSGRFSLVRANRFHRRRRGIAHGHCRPGLHRPGCEADVSTLGTNLLDDRAPA